MDERTIRHIRLLQGHTIAAIRHARLVEHHEGKLPRAIDALSWERALKNHPISNQKLQARFTAIVARWRSQCPLTREVQK